MVVRAKFKCVSKTKDIYNSEATKYTFNAVVADGIPENERFHKYSPSGEMTLTVNNPAIEGFYEIGKDYYLDFSLAE